jgi:hypothetical protein
MYCTVLYCTVLYCTVLYCTVLYCTVLYCTVLHCTMESSGYDASYVMYSREPTGRVVCLSFGPNRTITFPDGYFCSECKVYETDHLSTTFTPTEELNNPDMNVRRKDKVVTVRERLNHILTHDATFKNLKNEKKGNIVSDVIYGGDFLDSQSKDALYKKAREESREMHVDATFCLEEIYKSGANMNFTRAERLHRVDKQGEERRTGESIAKHVYGSAIPSRGQLSSVSAWVNHRANDIFAIKQIYTASGEVWKYADFSAVVNLC